MAEVKKEVKNYKVNYVCDSCCAGLMKPTGLSLTSYPEQYEHYCKNCGDKQSFLDRYPKTITEEV